MTVCTTTGLTRRSCDCPSCLGRRNRSRGLRAQREARKLMQIPPALPWGHGGDEELWQGSVRVEVKAGQQVARIGSAYRLARLQAGDDHRPFVLIARPIRHEPLAVLAVSDLPRVVAALADQWQIPS